MAELRHILELTAKIVSAYHSRNRVAASALPGLIQDIHSALTGAEIPPDPPAQEPAVQIRRSVSANQIICLEDGKPFMTLQRHLRTNHGMSPQQYRTKWGLPASYPMVARDYASRRSELSKKSRLGQRATTPTRNITPA